MGQNSGRGYGIDLHVEVFEDASEGVSSTLGEFFFIQSKGTETLETGMIPIKGEDYKLEVVKFDLETSELYTIEKMGAAVPTLLFVVDVLNEKIYYVCINDYIDKILNDEEPAYHKQKTKRIYIPISNCISTKKAARYLIRFSKRAKLYAFFNIVSTFSNDYNYQIFNDYEDVTSFFKTIFRKLLPLDIFEETSLFPQLKIFRDGMTLFLEKGILVERGNQELPVAGSELFEVSGLSGSYKWNEALILVDLNAFFQSMNSLGAFYETEYRAALLPKGFWHKH